MTVVRRYSNFVVSPTFVEPGRRERVLLAFDDENLTQWTADESRVWQTPLVEVHDLTVSVGHELRISARIAGAHYTWRARRGPEHDELIDLLRNKGAVVTRSRRGFAWAVASVVTVVVAASLVSVVTTFGSTPKPKKITYHPPSVQHFLDVQIQSGDLAPTWHKVTTPILASVMGSPGQVISGDGGGGTESTTLQQIFRALAKNYESCAGISSTRDRLFGLAGQQPVLSVNSNAYASSTTPSNYTEIMSGLQWYGPLARVQRDTNQYKTLSRFGACLTLNVGQTLDSGVAGTVASANTPLVVENFNPHVLVHAFVRAGVAPVAVTIDGVHYSVLSAFASTGHYELYLDVVTTNVTQGKAVLSAVLEAELARIVALP